jgi:hypothetical protein
MHHLAEIGPGSIATVSVDTPFLMHRRRLSDHAHDRWHATLSQNYGDSLLNALTLVAPESDKRPAAITTAAVHTPFLVQRRRLSDHALDHRHDTLSHHPAKLQFHPFEQQRADPVRGVEPEGRAIGACRRLPVHPDCARGDVDEPDLGDGEPGVERQLALAVVADAAVGDLAR